jgi:hypothetical protein
MNKPSGAFAKPLRDVVPRIVGETLARQGFASAELVTRWSEIVGVDIAVHSEPVKIQWPRPADGEEREPGTLVLRVQGPAAIEIQHQGEIICERVNRFFGWRAIARLALRQAPLRRNARKAPDESKTAARTAGEAQMSAKLSERLSEICDEKLKAALTRLAVAVKRAD